MSKRENRTRYTVLGMLSIDPMTGYKIKQMIQSSTAHFWSESEGQIYPALHQCVEQGLATCREKLSKGTLRSKKTYRITKKGREALLQWLQEPANNPLVRHELLLKLFFGANNNIADNIYHVTQQLKQTKQLLTIYRNLKKQLSTDEANSSHLPYWLITLDYGIKSTEAELIWCQNTLDSLNSEKNHV